MGSVGAPVIEGSSSQDDGVVVGPFRGVAPGSLQGIPEVAPGRVAHDPLREAPPHQEGKVHLRAEDIKQLEYWFFVCVCVREQVCFIFITKHSDAYLTGQQDRILVQTQHCFCLYGNVR